MESLSVDARQMVAFRSLSIINTWPIETKSAIMSPPTEHCRAASRKALRNGAMSLSNSHLNFCIAYLRFHIFLCRNVCLVSKCNSILLFFWPHYTLLTRASSLYEARKLCNAGFSIISLMRLVGSAKQISI